jgi:hypothetical protein
LHVIGPLEEGKAPYKFVETLEAAIANHGVFCCRRSLLPLLPLRRSVVDSNNGESKWNSNQPSQ